MLDNIEELEEDFYEKIYEYEYNFEHKAEKKQTEVIAAIAKEYFKNHEIKTIQENLLYLCSTKGTSVGLFYIIFSPRSIIVYGDVGDGMLQIHSLETMDELLKWARGAINSISYFFEKVPAIIESKKWHLEDCLEFIKGHPDEKLREEFEYTDLNEDKWITGYMSLYRCDYEDVPDFNGFSTNLLWMRECIKKFIELWDNENK